MRLPTWLLSNHSYSIIAGWSYNRYPEAAGNSMAILTKTRIINSVITAQIHSRLIHIAYNAPFYLIVKSSGNNRDENGPAVGSALLPPQCQWPVVNAGNRPAGISNNDSYDIISWDAGAKNILTMGAVNGLSGLIAA
jgi:hypothetical protein